MPTIFFLEAKVPLVKGYALNASGAIETTPYPVVKDFKSHKTVCANLSDLYKQILDHAKAGHCLLKGKLHRELNFESRKGATRSDDVSDWVCLDLDGAPFNSPEEFMNGHPYLKNVSYIVQYSASSGLGKPGLRCHIFLFLSTKFNVTYLKSWLMSLNLDGNLWAGKVRGAISLSNAKGSLHWPIDITCCQNDKLLFIAPPTVGPNVPYKTPASQTKLITKTQSHLDVKLIGEQLIEKQKAEKRVVLNALRKEAGLPAVRETKVVGEYEIQTKPGEAIITERWADEEHGFMRFNLNGGDSNAYYHPLDNFELIHNFKGEPSYYTKELLPSYYAECIAKRKQQATQPTEKGEVILGVCDKRSAALWKIGWHEDTQHLQLYPARSDKQLADWLMQHGKAPGDFTPQWNFEFNPQSSTVIDLDKQYLNTYVPSPYYNKPRKSTPSLDKCPTIKKVAMSIVSNNEWNEVTEHLMNWLAVLFQKRIKIGTCWVTGGTEGTGKGLFINKILKPLLGPRYVKEITITRLEDQFNGWLEQTLLCFVDEIQVSSSQHRKIIAGTLRNWITEPSLDMRNMNQMAYNAPNYTNFFMASNQGDPVEIDDADRRHNIGEFQKEKLVITDHEIDALIPQELDHFFAYLMTRKADVTNARTVIRTQSRKDVIDAGRNSVDMLADALLDGDISPFVEALPDMRMVAESVGADNTLKVAYDTIIRRELNALCSAPLAKTAVGKVLPGMRTYSSKLTRDELFVLFEYCHGNIPQSPNKFTRLLKHKGITTAKMRNAHGELAYGMHVTWTATAEWCKDHEPTQEKLRRVK